MSSQKKDLCQINGCRIPLSIFLKIDGVSRGLCEYHWRRHCDGSFDARLSFLGVSE